MQTQTEGRPEAVDEPARPRGSRPYLIGVAIDALGSGLWMPFGLIFFTRGQHLAVAQVGLALTLGGVIGLAFGPFTGTLVDRSGCAPALGASNVLRTATFVLYPLVNAAWQVALLAMVTAAADRMFWTANSPLLGRIASGRQLDRLLGTQSVIRIVGLGVGAALATPLAGSVRGLHAVSYLNALTFAVTALIVFPVARRLEARPAGGGEDDATPAQAATWGRVLRDRGYVLLCVAQLLLALAASSFVVILPLVALSVLHGPLWLPGGSIVVGNVVLAAVQNPAVRLGERTARWRVIAVSAVVFTAAFVLMLPGQGLSKPWVIVIVLASSIVGVIAEALFAPLMTAAANQAAPKGLAGRYSALFQTSWGAANVLAPAVCTGLLAAGYGFLWLGLSALVLLTIPILIYVTPRLPAGALRA